MQVLDKLKESFVSVIPFMGIVTLLHCTVAPLGDALWPFVCGGICIILGLGIFLIGAEIGLVPVGQKIGTALTARRSLPLLLVCGVVIGFFVTVAEPDVQVLATQVFNVAPSVDPDILILMIAAGVGLFVGIAVCRTVLRISYKPMLIGFYMLLFACAFFTDPAFWGIAFDAGGATTGPMTVPFIMALGLGIASAYAKSGTSEDQSFGFIGLASIGPVLAVLALGVFATPNSTAAAPASSPEHTVQSLWGAFFTLIPGVAHEVITALSPLAALVALFQITMLRLPPVQLFRTAAGFVYTFIGLVIFFLGVKGGFIPAGTMLGGQIAAYADGWLLLPIGIILGAVVVCAEPAVWVLNTQVEEVSGGHIKAKIMLVSLSAGVAIAVGIAMLRVWQGISIWYFLAPGYILTFILTRFCPPLFTAIAFDSGGVASGPMASTFILAVMLGASQALGGNPVTDAFGVIAMIAMTPLITIQILGILYDRKIRASQPKNIGSAR